MYEPGTSPMMARRSPPSSRLLSACALKWPVSGRPVRGQQGQGHEHRQDVWLEWGGGCIKEIGLVSALPCQRVEIGTGWSGQDHHEPHRPPLMSFLNASALTCHFAGLRKLVSNNGPQ